MASILFAWELGANLGHLTRDLPMARRWRDAGHRIVMAVPNLRGAANFLEKEGFILVQAPLLKSSIARTTSPVNRSGPGNSDSSISGCLASQSRLKGRIQERRA